MDPRFSQTTGGVDVKTWGPSPPDMIDLEVNLKLLFLDSIPEKYINVLLSYSRICAPLRQIVHVALLFQLRSVVERVDLACLMSWVVSILDH